MKTRLRKEDLENAIREIKTNKELESFIKENGTDLGEFNWHLITKSPGFSIKLASIYSDYIDWSWLCTFNDLSEDIIEGNLGYINWYSVSSFQNISYSFIKKYKDLLSMDKVIRNERVVKMKEYDKIYKIYESMKNDKKYQKVWENNLNNSLFKPIEMVKLRNKKTKGSKLK